MTNIIKFIIKLASWAHVKKQSTRAQAKSKTKGSRQKWTAPIPSTAPKSANPNCCKLNKFQIQNPRVVANSWAAQLSECFISTCCFSHPRSPKTGTDERLGREVKRVFSSMFYIWKHNKRTFSIRVLEMQYVAQKPAMSSDISCLGTAVARNAANISLLSTWTLCISFKGRTRKTQCRKV